MLTEISSIDAPELNRRFHTAHPSEICGWAAETFGDGLVLTSSFGAESLCAIHLVIAVKPDIPIVFINTGYLFPETLGFMEAMRHRYHLNVREYHSRYDPMVWLTIHGENDPRQRRDVEACCAAHKNEPFDRAMRELKPAAWIRGIRAEQSTHRAQLEVLRWNSRTACWAISPLLNWNRRQVHAYMKQHQLPDHPLWAKGYASIGCNPETCTRPIAPGDHLRSGRWNGLDKKECGLHLDHGAGI